jgi:hypothetical protein
MLIKKYYIIILFFLLLHSCGYSPIYSKNQKIDFFIESIELVGDNELKNFININLNNYSLKNNSKAFKIYGSINYQKNSISKNITGEIDEYNLVAEALFTIEIKDNKKILRINEKNIMNNFTDEFEELRYETIIKQNMAKSITSKLLLQLSKFNAN